MILYHLLIHLFVQQKEAELCRTQSKSIILPSLIHFLVARGTGSRTRRRYLPGCGVPSSVEPMPHGGTFISFGASFGVGVFAKDGNPVLADTSWCLLRPRGG